MTTDYEEILAENKVLKGKEAMAEDLKKIRVENLMLISEFEKRKKN